MQDAPLIYTKDGNVPVSKLTHTARWGVNDNCIVLEEQWHDESGTLVRNDVHAAHKDVIRDLLASSDVTVSLQGAAMGGQQVLMG